MITWAVVWIDNKRGEMTGGTYILAILADCFIAAQVFG